MEKITFRSIIAILAFCAFSVQYSYAINTTIIEDEKSSAAFACTGTVVNTFPYNESFETGIGLWTQDGTDGGDWTRDDAGTGSPNTGPSQASDGTFYYYTEASNNQDPGPNATTRFISPCIDLTGQSMASFNFDYHMHGSRMGTLSVEVSDNAGGSWTSVFSRTGEQHADETSPWLTESIDLSAYLGNTINIRFVGMTGNGFRSDMAIDNIVITATSATPQPDMNITGLGNNIFSGDNTPSTTDDTDFGTIAPASSNANTFTLENLGTLPLTLSGAPLVSISGTGASAFSLTTAPGATIAAGANTTFIITFTPPSSGTFNAAVSIASDDPDENPYTFDITGGGTDPYCAAGASDGLNNGIVLVQFNTINNASSGLENYGDYRALSTDVEQGSSHNLTVEVNIPGNFLFNQRAWIDWNQDNDFDDAGETYNLGSTNGGPFTNLPAGNSPLSITIPNTATLGATRLRIANSFNTVPSSCGTLAFGEYEDYTINVISGVPQPEMNITGFGVNIDSGDTTPIVGDGTDFGSVTTGSTANNTFTIENLGTADLNLTDASPYVTITGANAGLFTITAIPTTPITSGNTTTFQITYAPITGGIHNAIISIANDDSNENPYTFAVRGTGIGPEPEIAITGLGNPIVDGDTTPTNADGTDFGFVLSGGTTFSDFIISNSGTADLNLSGASPYVTISGAGAAEFSVITVPSPVISSSGGATTFRILYSPAADGTHNATISIGSDDNDENPYTFDITGLSTSSLVPEVDVTGNAISIPDGDTTPQTADNTDFGTAIVGIGRTRDFIISNSGTSDLSLTTGNPLNITGGGSGQFAITTMPVTTIAPGESTTFQITYTPTAAAIHTATVRLRTDDSDEDPYTFDITGTGIFDTAPQYTIYYENFDANNGGWVATNPGGNSVWTYGTNTVEPGTEGNYWYTNNYNDYAANSDTYATSPTLDLSGFENLRFEVDIRYNTDMDPDDGMNVEYSDDNGASWIVLGAFSATPISNWYNQDDITALGSGVDGWAGLNTGGSGGGRSDFLQAGIALPAALEDNAQVRLRFRFASNGAINDDGVNFDNVFIKGDPITPFGDPSAGPADVTSNLTLWLKANNGTSTTTDGNILDNWTDNAIDNDAVGVTTQRPIFYDNSTENINHNPVIDFNTVDDTELKGKGGFYLEEYWVVMQADGDINASSSLEGIISGRTTTNSMAEDGTGFWINPGSLRFQFEDNLVSHMIGSTPTSIAGISEGSYGRAYASATDSYDNEVIIFNIKTNAAGDQTEIYKNGERIDNIDGEVSASPFDALPYSESDNSTYALGVGRITIYGTPFDSHFNGKITEVISYAAPLSTFDQERIQSYLAIKNGVTLHDTNSTTTLREGDEDYIDSDGDVIWDVSVHNGFNYDIAGIGRDDASNLNQKQSKSVNVGSLVTMGLTDIYATNNDNIASNTNTIANQDFLMWGNDNAPLNAASPVLVDMSAGIAGLSSVVDFISVERTWKVVERGSIGEVKVSIPEISLAATLSPPGDYLMFVSETPTFSPTSEYRVMSLNGTNLEAVYDFNGTKYITFGYAPEYIFDRSITFDGTQDYMDAGDVLDLTGAFTMSVWVKNAPGASQMEILSKRNDAPFTEGYTLRLSGGAGFPRIVWKDAIGVSRSLNASIVIPENEWHHIALIYDGTTAQFYIDGIADTSANLPPPADSGDQHFLIGAADYLDPTLFYEGSIDEVRIWNIAISPDQLRFIMNQEIEEHSDNTVTGKIVPQSISRNEFSSTSWTGLEGYFPMDRYTFTNVKDESSNGLIAAIRNLDTVDFETAPLPYVSENDGDWDDQATWTDGTLSDFPASVSIVDNTQTIDWNIVQTAHNVLADTNNTVLSLQVTANELSVENDSKIEVSHYLRLDGTIDLVGESQLVQTQNSDLDLSSSGVLERDQQGTRDTFTYNYWSSPVGAVNNTTINQDFTVASMLRDGSDPNNPMPITFTGGLDGMGTTPLTLSAYWIFKYNNLPGGITANFQYVGPNGGLMVGEGFTMKGPNNGGVYDEQNYTFIGKPNNATTAETVQLPINGGNNYMVGNPFPSALDAHDFLADNPQLDGTLYFWEHFGGGSHFFLEYQGGYALYNLSGGTLAMSHPDISQIGGGTKLPSRYVPVAQGFFVNADSDGTIVFDNSQRNFVRETPGNSIFFETNTDFSFPQGPSINNDSTSSNPIINTDNTILSTFGPDDTIYDEEDTRLKFRIGFDTPTLLHRQLLLTVDENTSFQFDRMYDGIVGEAQVDDLSWTDERNDEKVQTIIQGVPNITTQSEFPLQLRLETEGQFTIQLDDIENFNHDYIVYLKDNLQNSYTNLIVDKYNGTLPVGIYDTRYSIVFEKIDNDDTTDDNDDINNSWIDMASATDDSDDTQNDDTAIIITGKPAKVSTVDVIPSFDIKAAFDKNKTVITIQRENVEEITNASLYSMLGQLVKEWSSTNPSELPVHDIADGAYILQLNTELGIVNRKVIIYKN